jgi:hypothetical protein
MLILAFVLSLELVIIVFLGFDNFQNFLEKSEARSRIRLCQDPQRDSWQKTDTSCKFSKENSCTREGKSLTLSLSQGRKRGKEFFRPVEEEVQF